MCSDYTPVVTCTHLKGVCISDVVKYSVLPAVLVDQHQQEITTLCMGVVYSCQWRPVQYCSIPMTCAVESVNLVVG